MKAAFNILEKVLLLLLVLSFSFLIFIQFFNFNDYNSINTSLFDENDLATYYDEHSNKGIIMLKNMDINYNDVSVLVNGEYVCDFITDDEVEIYVHNNDIVEIDGTKYNNKVYVKIVGISKNIVNPKLDTVVSTSQSIEILGKVQLK